MSTNKQKIMQPTPGYAKGGIVNGKGTSTSDSIPAKLSKGEAVLPAATVKHFGKPFIKHMIKSTPKEKGAETTVKKDGLHAAAGYVPDEFVEAKPVSAAREAFVNKPVVENITAQPVSKLAQIYADRPVTMPVENITAQPVNPIRDAIINRPVSTGAIRTESVHPMSVEDAAAAKAYAKVGPQPVPASVNSTGLKPDYVAPEPINYNQAAPKSFGGSAQGLASLDLARQAQGQPLVQDGYNQAQAGLEKDFGKKLPSLPGQMTAGTESTINALPGRLAEDFNAGTKAIGGALGGKIYDATHTELPLGIASANADESTGATKIQQVTAQQPVTSSAQQPVTSSVQQPAISQNDLNFSGPVEPDQTTGKVTQPGFIPSDTGLPYNVAKQADGKNTLNFTNPDGTGSGTISGLSGEQAGRMRDGKGSLSGQGLMLPTAAPAQPVAQQQPQQAQQIIQPQATDYSGQIADLMAQLPQSSRSDSIGTMVANKGNKNAILAKINTLMGVQKENNDQGSHAARLAAEQNQFNQRMADARTQQERDAIQQAWNNNFQQNQSDATVAHNDQVAQSLAAQNSFENNLKTQAMLKPQVVSSNIYKDGIINGQSQAAVQFDQKTGKPIVTPLDNNSGNTLEDHHRDILNQIMGNTKLSDSKRKEAIANLNDEYMAAKTNSTKQ